MRRKHWLLSFIILSAGTNSVRADEDELLPLPQAAPPMVAPIAPAPSGYTRPTVTIKPPTVAPSALPKKEIFSPAPVDIAPTRPAARAQVLSTTVVPAPEGVSALRRLVILPGKPSPDATRTSMLAAGETKDAVTCVGVQAPAPVLLNLASFFGNRVTPDSQKQLLETVQKGLAKPDQKPRQVQMVGWWPTEGVMAVAIDADDSGS
ncbi:MAG: hypothetical protein KDK97_05330 [Verrucomicrobiales bacterium]|nr:hypothetical protein [Verrucomicrobiales bacterium]MCP5558689.1 hypothetical protein [Verrucomicrobiaceae bacterium]